jgi:Biotin-requiring enzyme
MPEFALHAPFAGTVIAIAREPDDQVIAGEALVVLEAMKMGHEIPSEVDGVVDLRVRDEPAAVAAAKRDLSYFNGPRPPDAPKGPDALRGLIPANRKRVYDIRTVMVGPTAEKTATVRHFSRTRWIATLFDDDAPAEGWRTRPANRRPHLDAW